MGKKTCKYLRVQRNERDGIAFTVVCTANLLIQTKMVVKEKQEVEEHL